jgi:UDP-glucuronate 4-epimerase
VHIKKRKMQKADILKTHGNNNLVKKLTNFKNFTKVEIAIKNTSVWFRHNYKKLNFAK